MAADNGIVIAASYWGKFKTVSQMAMTIVMLMDLGGGFQTLETLLLYLSLVLTVISLVDYIWKNRQVISMQK